MLVSSPSMPRSVLRLRHEQLDNLSAHELEAVPGHFIGRRRDQSDRSAEDPLIRFGRVDVPHYGKNLGTGTWCLEHFKGIQRH